MAAGCYSQHSVLVTTGRGMIRSIVLQKIDVGDGDDVVTELAESEIESGDHG